METEEEQVERLKAWFKESGPSIAVGVAIGVGGIVGYKWWSERQELAAEQASSHFSLLLEAVEADNAADLQTHAERLIAQHAGSDYALMAHLALAKSHVTNGTFEQAELALQQVVGSAAKKPLAYIARARLAAVQIQIQQYESALATLDVDFPAEFAAQVAELKGDIYALQGNTTAAIAAYRSAQSARPGPTNGDFLRQKLSDLGARS